MRNSSFKVFHIFNEFLPPTQMWLHDLLSEIETDKILFAKKITKDHPGNHQLIESKTQHENSILNKIKKKLSGIVNGKLIREIDSLCKDYQPDLLHAHFADIACETMLITESILAPLVVSFYGWDYEMLPFVKPKYRSAYPQLFEKVSSIITEGPFGKAALVKQGCSAKKIKVIPLGIKLNKPTSRKRNGDKLKLIQVASFREKKGQIYTIKAFKKCLDQGLNAELTLVGDQSDPYAIEAMSLIKQLDLTDHIKVMGFINYNKLHGLLSAYDVFIQPSCYAANMDCEGGAPTTLFHAMHQGLPIIGTDHCDIPFVVEHKLNGLIAREKSVEEIAKCISEFAEMSDVQYHKYSQNGKHRLITHFDIKKNAQLLDQHYKKTAKGF